MLLQSRLKCLQNFGKFSFFLKKNCPVSISNAETEFQRFPLMEGKAITKPAVLLHLNYVFMTSTG